MASVMRRLILYLLVCYPVLLPAQNSAVRFHHLSTDQGLSNNDVRTIFQDSKGFLWIGTLRGLNKYDGYQFTVYEHQADDASTLVSNTINHIAEDTEHNLWIVTDKPCLSKLHLPSNTIKRYVFDNLPWGEINDIFVDGPNVWVSYYGGIGVYNRKKDHFERSELKRGKDYLDIASIVSLNDSILVLSISNDDRLMLFNKRTKETVFYEYKKLNKSRQQKANENTILLNDGEGSIWVGGLDHGLYKINFSNGGGITRYAEDQGPFRLSSNHIRSLYYNKPTHELWIGTDGGGLNIMNTRTHRGYVHTYNDSNHFGLSSANGIYSIYGDSNNIIWLGLYNGGLNYYNQAHKKFQSFVHNQQIPTSISNNTVMSLLEDTENRIWVGTDGGGLNEFNKETGTFRKISSGTENINVIASIENAEANHLLLGTWAKGLYLFDKVRETFKPISLASEDHKGVMNKSAWDILQVSKDKYWIATIDGGLSFYDHNTKQSVVRNELVNPNKDDLLDARTLCRDKANNVWVGTRQSGVARISSTRQTLYLHDSVKNSITSNDVRSILEDANGNIWFGTQDNGLCKMDGVTKQFSSINTAHGLSDNTVQSILEDNSGNLWLSGPKGITRYAPDSHESIHFDKSDGLPGNDFKYNASIKLSDGRLLFGSTEGLCMFQPDSILLDHAPHTIVFTDFSLFNMSVNNHEKNSPLTQLISYQRSIELKHWQSSFAIEFATLNFLSAGKNEYAFKLEGFDKEWNYVNDKHEATYTNIPPGEYQFVAKASDQQGVWSSSPESLSIVILPPWWRTVGAYISYVIIIIVLLFLFRRSATIKERTRNTYENSLNKLRLLSNVSHDLKTPLSLIQEPVEDLLQHDSNQSTVKRHEKYLLINRHIHRMKRIVDQFMHMAKEDSNADSQLQNTTRDVIQFSKEITDSFKLHAQERNILLSFKSNLKEINFWFNETHLENILYNLLSNAFKFTADQGNITVWIRLLNADQEELVTSDNENQQEFIQFSIYDNGIGIASERLDAIFERYYFEEAIDEGLDKNSGLGLSITKELVEMHNGTIHVKSEENSGSEFIVQFPVFNSTLGKEKKEDGVVLSRAMVNGPVLHENKSNRDLSKPLLLLVEDDIALRLQLMREFAMVYRLSDAEDGEVALRKIKESPPDLIISDVNMPKINGLDLCKTIKSKVATSHIPVILLTGLTGSKDQLSGIEHGADGYIEKPFSMTLLKAQVKNLLENRQQLRVKFQNTVEVDPRDYTFNKIDKEFLKELIQYIEDHIADSKINASQLTKAVGISRSLLYSKVKELTGESVNSFITNIRIKKSISFLVKGHSVSDTAYLVGFSSYSYFSRSFQKQLGKSPKQYLADMKIKKTVS
jgi:signal transduction histidine kinase/ligand-binding sensor domain-containing protein/DNA-binding response OmpR family regulator